MYIYKSRYLTRGEVWFDDEPGEARVDWIYYRQRSQPMAQGRWQPFYTVLLDLGKGTDQLRAEIHEKTQGKIRLAKEKDRISWELCNPRDMKMLDAVEAMWNESAAARKTARLDRKWLEQLAEEGALEISVTRDQSGRLLTGHLSYAGRTRAQDLIVVSPSGALIDAAFRARVNHANCLGHWQNILHFKTRGMRNYDFGGWYPGSADIRLLGMNAFKQGFGGQVIQEFSGEQIKTFKGRAVLAAARYLNRTGIWNGSASAPLADARKSDHAQKPLPGGIWPATQAAR